MNTTETLNTTTDGGITLTLLSDVEDHFNIVRSVSDKGFTIGAFGKHEFIRTKPWTAIPVIVILSVASFVGTAGNILTLLAIASNKKLRNAEMIFIVNLAISDLYVTAIADPLSIVGKCIQKVNPVLSGKSKGRPKLGFQDRLLLNEGQKYCRMNTFALH